MKKIFTVIVITIMSIATFTSCSKDEFHEYGDYYEKDGLIITSSVTSPNSVGGVKINITVQNYTGKTIKYISVAGTLKNYFGDAVYCEVRDQTGMSINITGPINDGDYKKFISNDCFYNNTAKEYCINVVSVQYL